VADARVLVTGGSGFVGRQVVAALHRLGADVAELPAPRPDLLTPAGRAEVLAVAAADTLVHTAWITSPGTYWTSAANLEWVAATLDLAKAFRAAGGRRFVMVGSCAEYDWQRPTHSAWRESRACRPRTPYGAAKLLTWAALLAFARQSGLSVASARVFVPVGRHEAANRLLPSLIHAALTGTEIATGPAELTRDFLDVRDAGEAIARLALSQVRGPVNVGARRPVTLGRLVDLVPGAAQVVRLGGRLPRAGEPMWMVPDSRRLRRAIGFTPRYPLDATIADAIACSAG
jgi:nucleoside-diphosphate-sugar epimerase